MTRKQLEDWAVTFFIVSGCALGTTVMGMVTVIIWRYLLK